MKWLLCRAGEHVSALDGAKYLVITDVQPGQQAHRSAPQLEPGLLLKEVNGISVRDYPTNDVMGMMGQRPLDLVFVREGGTVSVREGTFAELDGRWGEVIGTDNGDRVVSASTPFSEPKAPKETSRWRRPSEATWKANRGPMIDIAEC